VFPIPENKGNEDVDINAATVGAQTCGADVHFNTKNADEDVGPIPGVCLADVNFDAENIEDDLASSSNIMTVPDKGNKVNGSKDKNTEQVIEFCIAELIFCTTQTNETDALKETELSPYQDAASTNEVYEALQSSPGSDSEQDKVSTNEVYEKLQSPIRSDTGRDEASTNEVYEALQSPSGSDTGRDEASTNEVYEKIQNNTDVADVSDSDGSDECPTQVG
jgi:hypothetical protein